MAAEAHECQPPQIDSYHDASWECGVCGKRWRAKPYHRVVFGSQGTRDSEVRGKEWVEESGLTS
jgi:hypothetical protein